MGTLETTRAAYNRCIELKVITIKMLLNYATLLKSKKYFEDSFTVRMCGGFLCCGADGQAGQAGG